MGEILRLVEAHLRGFLLGTALARAAGFGDVKMLGGDVLDLAYVVTFRGKRLVLFGRLEFFAVECLFFQNGSPERAGDVL